MKKMRILPGAAGVIALTATIGFVDGQREIESEDYLRDKITQVRVLAPVSPAGAASGDPLVIKPDNPAYLVKIQRGDISKDVLIDAFRGEILAS
jgi:hypothetical protein